MARKAKDLTGQVFSEWTVLHRVDSSKCGNVRWLCRCSCGNEKPVSVCNLSNGSSKSCGCLKNKINDLTGQVFNKWTVLKREGSNKCNNATYLCRCECGEERVIIGNNLTKNKSKGCHKCAVTGENHYLWNFNLTDKEREINNYRQIPGYQKWRKEVFNRDNYACRICGSNKSGTLNTHHIEGFSNNPELRTTLSNGITLCETCHKDFHHQYGYGDNTREQLNKFINQKEN